MTSTPNTPLPTTPLPNTSTTNGRTGKSSRSGKGKVTAAAAAATLSLLGLAGLAGPAGANGDTTPPTADPMVVGQQPNENGWFRTHEVVVAWNWSDAESGLSSDCEQDTEAYGDGSHAFTAECTDNAGNVGIVGYGINIDTTPPVVTLDPDENELRFSATDELSGVYDVVCSINDRPVEGCESPIDLTDLPVGFNEISIRATDRASNVSERAYFDRVIYPEVPSGSVAVNGVRFIKKRSGDLAITGTQGGDSIHVRSGVEPGHVGVALGNDGVENLVWSGPVRNLNISTRNGVRQRGRFQRSGHRCQAT